MSTNELQTALANNRTAQKVATSRGMNASTTNTGVNDMKSHATESYRIGYENGLLGVCYTRADAAYNVVLVNEREVDLYMLGQGDGLYKRNNGWAAHL